MTSHADMHTAEVRRQAVLAALIAASDPGGFYVDGDVIGQDGYTLYHAALIEVKRALFGRGWNAWSAERRSVTCAEAAALLEEGWNPGDPVERLNTSGAR